MLIGNNNGSTGGQPGPVGPSIGYPNPIPGIHGGHHLGTIHTCSYDKKVIIIWFPQISYII